MKLDCILTAVNENALYIETVPFFINTWSKLYPNVDIKIILIATEIPEHLIQYEKFIILFKPINKINTSFTSQYIRLLYPCILNYKNGVMITDIDMIPMNRTYYTKNIENFTNDKFIYLRANWPTQGFERCPQFAMCYNVASSKIWSDIFKIKSIEDINERLIKINRHSGWSTDQVDLCKYVIDWNKKTNNLILVKDNTTGFQRLGRIQSKHFNEKLKKNILDGNYTDYHCSRPFKKYEEILMKIYELL